MGKRTWIDSDIWNDTEGLTNTELAFFIYLMTNSQRNIAGYYKVNLAHMAVDLRMSKARIEKLLCKEQKYWYYDPDTKQVLIPRFTRYNTVRSRSQVTAMNSEINRLHPCFLHRMFLKAFEECNGIGATELIDSKFRDKALSYNNHL